jgi:hypothetical protein
MKYIHKTLAGYLMTMGAVIIFNSCEENLTIQDGLNLTSNSSTSKIINSTLQIISNCDHPQWTTQNQAGGLGTIEFVNEPIQLLLGSGSLRFNCPDSKFLRYVTSQFYMLIRIKIKTSFQINRF